MTSVVPRLRIVDFSTHISGPIASHLLAEMGADVIKVENPTGGDGNRSTQPMLHGLGMAHAALNAGARSLTVSQRSPNWGPVVEACAKWADVVIVGTRPKDARRRGMDFATMQKANPHIVYCAVSGFGDVGAWRDHTAHGQTTDAFAGAVPVEWVNGSPETRRGWRTTGSTLSGVFAALGIQNAIYRRDHGVSHAQYVSVSLWASAMWWNWRDLTSLANSGESWSDYTDFGSRYTLYETADPQRVILVAPVERKFWERFCDVVGLPAEWRSRGAWVGGSGMDTGSGADYADEKPRIAERLGSKTLEEWTRLFSEQEIPFAPILTLKEALHSEHAVANDLMRETSMNGHPMKIVASPVRIAASDQPELGQRPPLPDAPNLGAHTQEILCELGLQHLVGRI